MSNNRVRYEKIDNQEYEDSYIDQDYEYEEQITDETEECEDEEVVTPVDPADTPKTENELPRDEAPVAPVVTTSTQQPAAVQPQPALAETGVSSLLAVVVGLALIVSAVVLQFRTKKRLYRLA